MTRFAPLLIAVFAVLAAAEMSEAAEYTVRQGDSLSKIAKQQLGSARRWKEIAELNNLRDPYKLRLGQKLFLPDDGAALVPSGPPDAIVRPVDPQPVVQPPRQSGPSWMSLMPPGNIWVWAAVGLLVFWAITAACLRAGCWFALVETTFARCMFLALLQAGLLFIFLFVMGLVDSATGDQHKFGFAWYAMTILVQLVHITLAVILTGRVLNCKWRSVLTVFVMAHLVAVLLSIGVMLTLQAAIESAAT